MFAFVNTCWCFFGTVLHLCVLCNCALRVYSTPVFVFRCISCCLSLVSSNAAWGIGLYRLCVCVCVCGVSGVCVCVVWCERERVRERERDLYKGWNFLHECVCTAAVWSTIKRSYALQSVYRSRDQDSLIRSLSLSLSLFSLSLSLSLSLLSIFYLPLTLLFYPIFIRLFKLLYFHRFTLITLHVV